ncbi:ectonucleotide pyrophosphatase/phosphodiesterase [Pseudoxanthomonas sp.]|uniref:alkaline phosphatase family protein n=1 Tax=Pseudoxanthomonas sp. TaxID=1871049 RepID=UPI002FDF94BB
MRLPLVRVTLLAALLWVAGCATTPASAPPPLEPHGVVLVSIDGLRADIPGSGRMPTLDALFAQGARAAWVNPSYPTLTFPNHYTLVTGLRPDRHGIVHNDLEDPVLGRFASKKASGRDGRFWGGEPIWIAARRAGLKTATMFWPGSEAEIAGGRPDHWRPFDGTMTADARVAEVLGWLDLPPAERPRFITLYLEQYDVAAHAAGTFSPQALDAMADVDAALATLVRGLDARGLRSTTNLIVLSDHGMADVRTGDTAYLDDVLPESLFSWSSLGPVAHITPRPGHEAEVTRRLIGRHDHYTCWNKEALPAAWHYGRNPRIAPFVCQSDTGWRLQLHRHPLPARAVKGEHGFVPEDPQMRAFFVASGPDFVPGVQLPAFDNVDVYPLLAHLLRIAPAPNDGTLDTFAPALTPRAGSAH